MESDTHFLYFIKLSGKSLDFYFLVGIHLIKATYVRRQVILCVTKASACHYTLHANHWVCLWQIPPIIAGKGNATTFIQVLRFGVNMFFFCGRVALTVLKHADIKGVRQRLTSTMFLDDGYCEATIPVLKWHHVTQQWERRMKRLSLRAHIHLLRGDY